MSRRARVGPRVALVALAALGVASRAHAEVDPRLDYSVPDNADCPSEADFQRAVAARLGREPFVAESTRRLAVEVRLENSELSATGALVEADGTSAGIRRLTGKPGDCRELVEGMALAASLALSGDLGVTSPPDPALPPVAFPPTNPTDTKGPPKSAQAPAPSAMVPVSPASLSEREDLADEAGAADAAQSRSLALGAGLTGQAALGVGPGVGVGGTLFGFGRSGSWSLSVEARLDGLSQLEFDSGGSATTSLLAGVLSPCRHFERVRACALALAGSIQASSHGVTLPDSDAAPYAALGARLGVDFPLSRTVFLEGRLDGLLTLLPVDIELGGETVWSSPFGSAALGMGAFGLFP
jgi:hypothetical protein